MKEIIVTFKLEGVSRGMFPVGKITEMLYRAIEYLEPRDRDGLDMQGILPIEKKFREYGAALTLSVKEEKPPSIDDPEIERQQVDLQVIQASDGPYF